MAWLVSLAATGGSLYLSEILHYIPCNLCWFQRIFMYPLALLLGRAALKDDRSIAGYVLPLSVIGGLFSLYHYMEQKVPGLDSLLPCRTGVPCNVDYLDWFGFITIPLLALIAFVLITVLLLMMKRFGEEPEDETPAA
ncbi:disulfide bond formation protein B [Cohnella lubricantis]|uniref:Disulfide bond formation protein B n=2 Tax=Cohnella lubricantis TaxID=2163172 RepID=A0A841TBR0_9BACL|nr:disulfide bond formation protein B [Cohnella lubricantis]